MRNMLDRRQFVGAAAAGTAAILTRASGGRVGPEAAADTGLLSYPYLVVALGPGTVREIGEAYRALVPAESNRASLETALRSELGIAHTSAEDLVRADFAAGRVIVVRDWVLSVTEARQCALFSLRSA